MRPWSWLSLPPALLLLISTSPWQVSGDAQLSPGMEMQERDNLEDERLVKRAFDAMEKLQSQPPTRVRKMSGDPEEMFFLDYWGWDDDDLFTQTEDHHTFDNSLQERALPAEYFNDSSSDFLLPALRPNAIPSTQETFLDDIFRFFQRSNIAARDFACPTNSTPCASLNRTDICCGSGENCYIGEDQGCGTVGCCPQGTTCSGPVQCCNTAAGYSNCQATSDVGSNGGCCIPDFTCYGTGCKSAPSTAPERDELTNRQVYRPPHRRRPRRHPP